MSRLASFGQYLCNFFLSPLFAQFRMVAISFLMIIPVASATNISLSSLFISAIVCSEISRSISAYLSLFSSFILSNFSWGRQLLSSFLLSLLRYFLLSLASHSNYLYKLFINKISLL